MVFCFTEGLWTLGEQLVPYDGLDCIFLVNFAYCIDEDTCHFGKRTTFDLIALIASWVIYIIIIIAFFSTEILRYASDFPNLTYA